MNEFTGRPKVVRPMNWKYAACAGFIAGVVFFVVSRGIPWASGLSTPTVVGRELHSPTVIDPGMTLVATVLHFLFSVGYGLIVAPIVNRFRAIPALLVGGVLGFALYFVNDLIFSQYFSQVEGARKSIAIVTHIAFGMVAAGAYKGLARPRVETSMDAVEPDRLVT